MSASAGGERTGVATGAARLLAEPVVVVNLGLEGFLADLKANGIEVLQVDWAPPAGGDPKMAAILAKLGV